MRARRLSRALLAVPLVLALTVTLAVSSVGSPAHQTRQAVTSGGGPAGGGRWFPDRIELPDGFAPEGITIRGKVAYVGSLSDGDIYAASLVTGRGTVISQGPGTPSVGLTIDHRKRLFVAGGPAGDARVVDARTGRVLASYQLAAGPGPTFVNDVVLTTRVAWFTDSMNAVLYGLPLGRHGRLPASTAVLRLPLSGDWVQQAGFNANGIELTPDRRALLVVQSNTGLLFRVDPRSGVARRVDLGGATLAAGDGLLVVGRTLYVVQNQLNQVAVIRLSRDGGSGVLRTALTSPGFDFPTTAARFGRWLYLPNARFATEPTPTTEYWVTRIRR